MPNPKKSNPFTGVIVTFRHILRQRNHSAPGHDHHALLSSLLYRLIHQQRILTG